MIVRWSGALRPIYYYGYNAERSDRRILNRVSPSARAPQLGECYRAGSGWLGGGNIARRVMHLLSTLTIVIAAGTFAQDCEQFSNEGGDYYEAISDCGACTANSLCGFCLSTLQCLEGRVDGPSNGLPCSYWLATTAECPEIPQCEQLTTCGACVDMDDCAWCASEQRCLTVSEIFMTECEGSIFDAPCPSSSVFFSVAPRRGTLRPRATTM